MNEKIRERIRAINEIELTKEQIVSRICNDIFASQRNLEEYAINGIHKVHLGQNIFLGFNQSFCDEFTNILRIINNSNTIPFSDDEFLFHYLSKIFGIILDSEYEFQEDEKYYFEVFNEMNIVMRFDNDEVLIELKDEEE